MISVYDFLYQRLSDYSKKYQAGFDIMADFNSRLDEVQKEIFNQFQPYYSINEQVRRMLSSWVVEMPLLTSDANGLLIIAAGDDRTFCRMISMFVCSDNGIIQYEAHHVDENELGIIQRIPQRKPNVAKRNVYYIEGNEDNQFRLHPNAAIKVKGFYFIYPTKANLAFTYTEVNDEDVMTVDTANTVDLNWNESAANIILYKMLEKYGVSVREQLLMEYSRLGVTQTAINNGN